MPTQPEASRTEQHDSRPSRLPAARTCALSTLAGAYISRSQGATHDGSSSTTTPTTRSWLALMHMRCSTAADLSITNLIVIARP